MTKPLTQGVTVDGIAPKPVNTPDGTPINWHKLAGLPPFQAYVGEKTDRSAADSLQMASQFISEARAQGKLDWLVDDYTAWFNDRGLWPRETPFGELKNAT